MSSPTFARSAARGATDAWRRRRRAVAAGAPRRHSPAVRVPPALCHGRPSARPTYAFPARPGHTRGRQHRTGARPTPRRVPRPGRLRAGVSARPRYAPDRGTPQTTPGPRPRRAPDRPTPDRGTRDATPQTAPRARPRPVQTTPPPRPGHARAVAEPPRRHPAPLPITWRHASLRIPLPHLRRHIRAQPAHGRVLGSRLLPRRARRHREAALRRRGRRLGRLRALRRRRWRGRLLRRGLLRLTPGCAPGSRARAAATARTPAPRAPAASGDATPSARPTPSAARCPSARPPTRGR